MKRTLLVAVCLFLTACGGSSSDNKQSLDYFSGPVKITALVTTGALTADNLIISGISRTPETVTLNFSITITNTGPSPQNVAVILSGKDRYNLEVMAPVITATMQAGETRVIDQQQTINAALLFQVESWLISAVTPIDQTTTPTPSVGTPVTTPQVVPIATDATGTVQLITLEPIENFRTLTNVNFSTKLQFQNMSSARTNYRFTINGANSSDNIVFSRNLFNSLEPKELQTLDMSYGEPLTVSEYDSVTKWFISDFTRY